MDVPIRHVVPQIVTSERYLSLLLGFLVLAIFVFPALGFEGSDERLYADIMFTLLLVSGMAAALDEFLKASVVLTAVTLIALLVKWGSWLPAGAALNVWREPTTLAAVLLMAVAILRRVLAAGSSHDASRARRDRRLPPPRSELGECVSHRGDPSSRIVRQPGPRPADLATIGGTSAS